MSTVQLRQQAKAVIDDLSTNQLRVATEFLAFVKSREMDTATLELLLIPGLRASFDRGMGIQKGHHQSRSARGSRPVISAALCPCCGAMSHLRD